MNKTKSLYHGHRFPAVVISCAVRWYFRFNLSLRDIEELLLRGHVRGGPLLGAISSARASPSAPQGGAAQAG
jgi:hypothetical protein